MSEAAALAGGGDSSQETVNAALTAGQLLRAAREAKGLHVAALAVSLKVPVKKLEALEADRLEDLPDAVFVRALASSVCRALKIDPTAVLAKLPQLNTRVLDQTETGMNLAFPTRSEGAGRSVFTMLSRPVVLGVLALLLAALVIMLMPEFSARTKESGAVSASVHSESNSSGSAVALGAAVAVPSTPSASAADATSAPASAPSVGVATSAAPAGAVPSGASQTSESQAGVSPTSVTPTVVNLTPTPALSLSKVASSTVTISSMPGQSPAPPVPVDSVVTFVANGETWIEVRDSAGKVIVQRTLQLGEKAGAGPSQGKLPFSVIVGRVNFTQVSVRGQAFDLAPVSTNDEVARFQVK